MKIKTMLIAIVIIVITSFIYAYSLYINKMKNLRAGAPDTESMCNTVSRGMTLNELNKINSTGEFTEYKDDKVKIGVKKCFCSIYIKEGVVESKSDVNCVR